MSENSGVGRRESGNKATYLRIAGGSIWQTGGDIDTSNPNYKEEAWETADKSGIRKGYKYDYIAGTLNSVFFKPTDYGTILNVYIDTVDGLYDLQFKIDGSWTSYQLAKKMMIALLMLDLKESFRIEVFGSESNGFSNVNIYVKQGGKSFTLETRWEDGDDEKFKPIPADIKDLIKSEVEVVSAAEIKDMEPEDKKYARYSELKALRLLVEAIVIPSANAKVLAEQEEKKEEESREVEEKEEVKEEPKKEEPKKEVNHKKKTEPKAAEAGSLQERLRKMQEAREKAGK